jgi:hypothetical protein
LANSRYQGEMSLFRHVGCKLTYRVSRNNMIMMMRLRQVRFSVRIRHPANRSGDHGSARPPRRKKSKPPLISNRSTRRTHGPRTETYAMSLPATCAREGGRGPLVAISRGRIDEMGSLAGGLFPRKKGPLFSIMTFDRPPPSPHGNSR